jgi:uncharacterized membrane protein YcaP (DUF421 family)
MNPVLRAATVYLVLLVVFRLAGKRTLAQVTSFDLVLLLIISEAVAQALVGDDFSLVNALLIVLTLVLMDVALGFVKRSREASKWLEGLPVVIVEDGRLLPDRIGRTQVDEDDVLTAAQRQLGLERLDQIKYAVLERSGGIAVIPKRSMSMRRTQQSHGGHTHA